MRARPCRLSRKEKEGAAIFDGHACELVIAKGKGIAPLKRAREAAFAGPPRGAASWVVSSDSPQTWAHVHLAERRSLRIFDRRPAAPSTPLLR